MSEIHATAVVSPRAKIGDRCKIGPYAIVGDEVTLGEGCEVLSHVCLQGPAMIGRGNTFHPFCSIGGPAQDLKYHGEPSSVSIDDHNVFREYVTVSRGTAGGQGITRIGSHNFLMAYVHIAHDCVVGNHTIFGNAATLAGHVVVEDYANVGAFCAIHQFCRIGTHGFLGAGTVISQDVLPFSKTVAPRDPRVFGANTIGLERRGFSPERIGAIQAAFRLLCRSSLNTSQAMAKIRETLHESEDVEVLLRFIETCQRGFIR
jgi:UDP-N-acetylglucosamine acyltransferase